MEMNKGCLVRGLGFLLNGQLAPAMGFGQTPSSTTLVALPSPSIYGQPVNAGGDGDRWGDGEGHLL